MDLHLKDRVVLVTGGSRGLGKSVCLALAAEGAKVALCARQAPAQVADQMRREFDVGALAVQADVSNESDVRAMFERIEAELGPVDVLVNNAGVAPAGGPMTDIAWEEWERTFRTNVGGMFLCSRELVRRLLKSGRAGRIVNISSQAAFRGSQSGKLAYDSSKGAIISFTIALARELAPAGICVNCVAPGLLRTEMLAAAIDADPRKYNSRVPLGRIARTEEIANVVVFLCSDRASYMTGATVDVSGGLAMH